MLKIIIIQNQTTNLYRRSFLKILIKKFVNFPSYYFHNEYCLDIALKRSKFRKELSAQGRSKERSFLKYKASNNLKLQRSTKNYLSIDFSFQQSDELKKKHCYVIRAGKGKFVIFDKNRFQEPYLNLDLSRAEELDYEIPKNFEHLGIAFYENENETSSIEYLWFLGVFKQIIGRVSSESKYYIGPRGTKHSVFDVYFKDKNAGNCQNLYTDGQEDLDYSIFTENCIYFFEAKKFSKGKTLTDIGWYKIVYPVSRFKECSGKRLIPGYFLRLQTVIYFFVFPDFRFYKEGVIPNDEEQFIPKYIFKINLNT